mgnify:FL=1
MEENAMLKGKLLTLKETLTNSELETKASRETIMRLVSEMGKDQQYQSRVASDIDTLRSVSSICVFMLNDYSLTFAYHCCFTLESEQSLLIKHSEVNP